MSKLKSIKRERFCQEYVCSQGSVVKAMRAGGYSVDSKSRYTGYRLLKEDVIKNRISEIREEYYKDVEARKIDVLEELVRIASSDMGDFVEWGEEEVEYVTPDGTEQKANELKFLVKDSAGLKNVRKVVKKVSKKANKYGDSFDIEFHDKVSALRALGQYTGVLKEHEVTNNIVLMQEEANNQAYLNRLKKIRENNAKK